MLRIFAAIAFLLSALPAFAAGELKRLGDPLEAVFRRLSPEMTYVDILDIVKKSAPGNFFYYTTPGTYNGYEMTEGVTINATWTGVDVLREQLVPSSSLRIEIYQDGKTCIRYKFFYYPKAFLREKGSCRPEFEMPG